LWLHILVKQFLLHSIMILQMTSRHKAALMNCSFITTSCSTTSDYVLKALPTISAEYVEFAEKLKSAFTGDPSFFAYNGEEEETQQDEEVLLKHLIYNVPNAHSITLCLAFQLLFHRWTITTLIALHANITYLISPTALLHI
jgi:hypothetical protein